MTKKGEGIIQREKVIFGHLLNTIKKIDNNVKDQETLQQSIDQLDELFLIVIVGEFNAGKSSFMNALLGDRYMKEGVIPTTTTIHVVKYGDHFKDEYITHKNQHQVSVPLPWLKGMIFVDTPGTNAIIREHQAVTEHFVPRSDVVLFLTSSERPFSESEREFMKNIKEWGKKVVVICNKIDLLKDQEIPVVKDFIIKGISSLLEFTPELFGVSSKDTLDAKIHGNDLPETWKALEDFLFQMIENEKIKLKLLSPMGVSERIVDQYSKIMKEKMSFLESDAKTIHSIEAQMNLFKQDIERDYKLYEKQLDTIFYQLVERADKFFDETIHVQNIFNLKKETLNSGFQKNVIEDIVSQIEKYTNGLIDFLIERKYKQHKSIGDFITKKSENRDMIGSINSEFHFNRQDLILKLTTSLDSIMRSKKIEDFQGFNSEITKGIYNTFGVELGAIGIGALSHLLLPTLAMELTGMLAGLGIGLMGLYVLPSKRKQLKKQFRDQAFRLNDRLKMEFVNHFDADVSSAMISLTESVSPFSRFVRAEVDKVEKEQVELLSISYSIQELKREIEATSFRQEDEEKKQISN